MLKCNSIKAPMGVENSACDLLTMCTLKNTDAADNFQNDQHILPRAAQITKCFMTCFFWVLNNEANISNLLSAKVSKTKKVFKALHLKHYIIVQISVI